jgi:hypothetical protein
MDVTARTEELDLDQAIATSRSTPKRVKDSRSNKISLFSIKYALMMKNEV